MATLPRFGPGSDLATLEALRRLPVPAQPVVYDVVAGTGRQTLALARALNSRVVAVDPRPELLHALEIAALSQHLAPLVALREGDVLSVPASPASIDLLWSEWSVQQLGLEAALKAWHPLLKSGAHVAVTTSTWTSPNPPAEAKLFWRGASPTMATVDENLERAQKAGFRTAGHFPLPRHAWFAEYADHLKAQNEVSIYQRFSDTFACVFYLLQKRP
jgi:ubiquinone/menaquinone biosynthesis C-methylase UbiE